MDEAVVSLIFLAIALSPIWVLIDAPKRGMSRAWALGALLFWVPVFPLYLYLRAGATKRAEQPRVEQQVQANLQPAAAQQAPGQAPPAWLPDPWFPGRFRYWDGTRWTSNSSDSPK